MIGEKSGLPAENSFNAIRLIAALQVAYIHSTWHLDIGFNPNSWAMQFPGLPMFFAISGCLVSDSLTRSKTLIQFAARRASRIYRVLAAQETEIYTARATTMRLPPAGQLSPANVARISAPRMAVNSLLT